MAVLDPAKGARPSPPRRTNARLYTDTDPLGLIPFARKVALCQQIDAAARARDPRVVQVSASLSGSWSVIDIVRPDGFVAHDVRPLVRLNVQIVVEQNGRREAGFHGLGGRYLYDDLFDPANWNRAIDIALDQALVNLRDWKTVQTMASGGVKAEYMAMFSSINPDSWIKQYGPYQSIRIKLLSIQLVGGGRGKTPRGATVRFQRSLFNKSSGATRALDNKIATIEFTYKQNLEMDDQNRIENPLALVPGTKLMLPKDGT